jgi:hypothetical protein
MPEGLGRWRPFAFLGEIVLTFLKIVNPNHQATRCPRRRDRSRKEAVLAQIARHQIIQLFQSETNEIRWKFLGTDLQKKR